MEKKSVLKDRWEKRDKRDVTRISVHGSRTLKDERVKILIMEEIAKYEQVTIVTHGEPEGVCKVARELCREKAIPLTLHFLDFKRMRGAFYHRGLAVFYDSDRALFIHDGVSKGCKNEKELADKLGIPYEYHMIEQTEYKTSVGFEPEISWGEIELPDLDEIPDIDIDSIE